MNNLASALKHKLCNVKDVCSEKSAVTGLQKRQRGQSRSDLFGNCSMSLGCWPEASSTISPVCDWDHQHVPGTGNLIWQGKVLTFQPYESLPNIFFWNPWEEGHPKSCADWNLPFSVWYHPTDPELLASSWQCCPGLCHHTPTPIPPRSHWICQHTCQLPRGYFQMQTAVNQSKARLPLKKKKMIRTENTSTCRRKTYSKQL